MESILRLSGIVKTFPGVVALENMKFELRPGEIHAVCGENGAGKSTLMKVITGVYEPDSGEIWVEGEAVKFKSPNDAFRKGIAIIHQETSLFEGMTVMENMFLGHETTKKIAGFTIIDYFALRQEARRIFKLMNISMDLNDRVEDLGMAQKQMLEIAKALTFQSKILILDEPTASLTQREVDALFAILRKLKADGVAIAYISHRLEEIFGLCDRVTVIRDGSFITCCEVKDTTKDKLVEHMVGRSMSNYYPKSDVKIGGELIRAENIGQKGMLKDINFSIRKGEIVGFAGLVGAGRTELAQAICGLTKLDSGTMYIDGKEMKFESYREAIANHVVYVHEDRAKFSLVLEMSIRQNITLSILKKISKRSFINESQEEQVSSEYIESMGIKAPDSGFLVANLSGGNQQKVSVSKALATEPKLLILDEPTRGVDVNAKAEIHQLISSLVKNGLTIFLISSEMPELLGMCDRIYVMKSGTITGELNRQEATQEKILKLALAAG